MESQDLDAKLEALSKEQMAAMLSALYTMTPANQSCIDTFLSGWQSDNIAVHALHHKLDALWQTVRAIIEEAEVYGACSYTREEEAASALYEMEQMAADPGLDWTFRQNLIDSMMDARSYESTGFEDQLYDVSRAFCHTPAQLAYLASLFSTDMRAEAHRAAALYEEAGMKDKAMELRLATLENESDYLQVAHKYEMDRQWEKAEEVLLQGLHACHQVTKERMTRHLAELYLKYGQSARLEALRQEVLSDDNPYEIQGIASILYQDAKSHGRYDRQKELLKVLLETGHANELQDWYQEARLVLLPQDLEALMPVAYAAGKERNIGFYLDLCMENGRHQEVLSYLQEHVASSHWENRWGFWVDKDHKYSDRLEEEFPEEIYAYYKEQAEAKIAAHSDHNDIEAGKLLCRMRHIRKRQNQLPAFQDYLKELHKQHPERRKLQSVLEQCK